MMQRAAKGKKAYKVKASDYQQAAGVYHWDAMEDVFDFWGLVEELESQRQRRAGTEKQLAEGARLRHQQINGE